MSITFSVRRRVRTLAAVVLVVAVVAAVVPGGVADARRSAMPARPAAPRGPEDIPGRITSLSALVGRRSSVVTIATDRRDDVRVRLTAAQGQETAAMDRTSQLAGVEADAAVRYEKSRGRVANLAAAAYRDGPSVMPISHLLSATSAADYSYRHEIVERVGALQRDMVRQAKHDRVAARRAADEARAERIRLHGLVGSLQRQLPGREVALTEATASRDRAQFWLARWQAIAGGTATSIMGTSRLGPDELTTWFTSTRHRANTTVPIAELANDYIEEGAAVGVRADIAFAQSMLETGGFSFPAGGQVRGTDNNFAGMGACDSCNGGLQFPDARTGVRAQLQQLRVYADARLTNSMLNPPAVNPKLDRHHLKGKVPTWGGLTGTWATARTYGDRIIGIYSEILAWLQDKAKV
jgi:Mannosyl-glycoprotein endo-beta-N-acetylglucosaminidase